MKIYICNKIHKKLKPIIASFFQVSPKSVLEKHFPNGAPRMAAEMQAASQAFITFDQPTFV